MEANSTIDAVTLLQQTHDIAQQLDKTISSITQEQFNMRPFADSWTAGQVAEHIYKSLSGITSALSGQVKDCHRAPDEHVKQFAAVFLDYSIQMKSPEFIIPSDDPHDKKALLVEIKQCFNAIISNNKTRDLSMLCLDFEMPGVGNLTRLEAH